MALKMVYDALDEFMALSVRDMLTQEGIGAMIRANVVSGYNLGLMSNTGQAPWQVFVEEEDLEKAGELLGGFLGSLGELAEAEELEDAP